MIPTASIRSLSAKVTSGGTPSRAKPEYFSADGSGHLWVKSKELQDGVIAETEERISDEGLNGSSAKYLPASTVLLAMYGANVGQLGWLRVPATVNQAICGLIINPDKADFRYVFYALMETRAGLVAQAQGAAQQNLNQDKIKDFEIPCPSLPTQRRIASILSAYDDLIENNTRRIAILEEMARRTYEEWFVRFRFPGHEAVRMVESELGPVPEGWRVRLLGDEVELAYGKALKSEERKPGDVPVYGSSGVVGYHDVSLVDGPGIIVGRKGNVGSVHWSDVAFYPIDTVYYVKTTLPLHFTFFNLQRQNFLNNDAAVPGLNRNQAYALPLLLPDEEMLASFESQCGTLLRFARLLAKKNTNLRTTRDLLLPKLISGELDVRAVAVPEAAAA